MHTRFPDKLIERIDRIDRKRLQDYFREIISETIFYEETIRSLEEGILVLDKNGLIKVLSLQAERLLGVSGERVKLRMFDKCPLDPELIKIIKNKINL